MENNKRYNIYIMSDNTGKAQRLIGSDMNEKQAEKRVNSGLMRIDRDNFFVADYEVGSKADLDAKKDLADSFGK